MKQSSVSHSMAYRRTTNPSMSNVHNLTSTSANNVDRAGLVYHVYSTLYTYAIRNVQICDRVAAIDLLSKLKRKNSINVKLIRETRQFLKRSKCAIMCDRETHARRRSHAYPNADYLHKRISVCERARVCIVFAHSICSSEKF